MDRTFYKAAIYGPSGIALLSYVKDNVENEFGPDADGTIVTLASREGQLSRKGFEDEFVDLVTAPNGEDVWLLTRFGALYSYGNGQKIADISHAVTDQFIGITWLGTDLVIFGSNSLLRTLDPVSFASTQLSSFVPLPVPVEGDMQTLARWTMALREIYAISGSSVRNFITAQSHGEMSWNRDGLLTTIEIDDARQTRFADLTVDEDGTVWLAGATTQPRIAILKDGTSQIIVGGWTEQSSPTSIAAYNNTVFVGDEGSTSAGLWEVNLTGLGNRWDAIKSVVALEQTDQRLWIVGFNSLHVIEENGVFEINLESSDTE